MEWGSLAGRSSLHVGLLAGAALIAYGSDAASAQDGGVTQLQAITVQGRIESAFGPAKGIVAKDSAAGTKTDTPLIETPQSISVVTSEQMQEQAVQSTSEALRYVPGITSESFGADPRGDWIRSRGFQIPEYLDGLRVVRGAYAWSIIDPYLLERAEVVKGPASSLYGQTPPGGLLNLVSKRPTDEPYHEVELQTGYPGRAQTAFDFGGPLDKEGIWSYRLTGLGRLADTGVDYVDDNRLDIAPAVTWKPDESTSLTVLGHYVHKDGASLQFLPAYGTLYDTPYGRLNRDFFVGEPKFDDFKAQQYGIGYQFEHKFDNGVTLHQNLRYSGIDYDLDVVRTHPAFGVRADGRHLARIGARIQDEVHGLTVDTNLTDEVDTGAVHHKLLGGIDYLGQKEDYYMARASVADLDMFDPHYGATVGPFTASGDQDKFLDQIGVYLQDEMTLGGFHLVLSGRQDWSDARTFDYLNDAVAKVDDSKFTGRAGLLYEFSNGIAPYVSYATSYEPQVGLDDAGNAYVPTTGEQVEAGVKYQPTGSNSLYTLAAYQITQDNLLTTSTTPGAVPQQVGQARVRGFEAEAKMDLSHGWQMIASYAYQDAQITRATDGTEGNRLPYVPEHQASAWLDYTFDGGALAGLTLGGGLRYAGASYGDNKNQIRTGAYTLVDASIAYDFGEKNPQLKGLKLAVNAANLFDEEYVASCNDINACYWGTGRTVRGTLSYRW